MKLKQTMIIFLFITLISCKPQHFTLDNLPEKQLIFGKGGGITGATDTYILLENGQLFHMNSMTGKSVELESIPENKSEAFFNQLKGLQLAEIDFNHPGNVYYFIEEVELDDSSKIVWGSFEHGVNPLYKDLYDNLMNLLN
ncbi:hypothetical protein Q2T41_11565 [Maribacter confluentis]|uniref:DUF4369 domain-containing protein n=1 Tax=Maribacter confluentis TaxID=1656093 RepID=A0ABT8RQY6_9FLAO|nr:hypothetical protein [Maribacter confluentis]MDO1513294.1 hypothetical protein [Maribacter confluentis]